MIKRKMDRKVLIVEEAEGWGIFDAESGDELAGNMSNREEALRRAGEMHFEAPPMNKKGRFFADMDGRPLFMTKPARSGNLELEYADGIPCLDFEICAECNGPAFGRASAIKKRNCYFCPSCGKDVDCVPPEEWIGEMD